MAKKWENYLVFYITECKNSHLFEQVSISTLSESSNQLNDLREILKEHKPNIEFPLNSMWYILEQNSNVSNSEIFINDENDLASMKKQFEGNFHYQIYVRMPKNNHHPLPIDIAEENIATAPVQKSVEHAHLSQETDVKDFEMDINNLANNVGRLSEILKKKSWLQRHIEKQQVESIVPIQAEENENKNDSPTEEWDFVEKNETSNEENSTSSCLLNDRIESETIPPPKLTAPNPSEMVSHQGCSNKGKPRKGVPWYKRRMERQQAQNIASIQEKKNESQNDNKTLAEFGSTSNHTKERVIQISTEHAQLWLETGVKHLETKINNLAIDVGDLNKLLKKKSWLQRHIERQQAESIVPTQAVENENKNDSSTKEWEIVNETSDAHLAEQIINPQTDMNCLEMITKNITDGFSDLKELLKKKPSLQLPENFVELIGRELRAISSENKNNRIETPQRINPLQYKLSPEALIERLEKLNKASTNGSTEDSSIGEGEDVIAETCETSEEEIASGSAQPLSNCIHLEDAQLDKCDGALQKAQNDLKLQDTHIKSAIETIEAIASQTEEAPQVTPAKNTRFWSKFRRSSDDVSNLALDGSHLGTDDEMEMEMDMEKSTNKDEDHSDDSQFSDMPEEVVAEPISTAPLHLDPRVNAALLTLIGMGLENEGNLAEILELVDGDIASALELIEIPK